MTRRSFLANSGQTAAISATVAALSTRIAAAEAATGGSGIRHSVCKWCYGDVPLDELCAAVKEIGLESIELLMPSDRPVLEKHGLTCAITFNPVGVTGDGTRVGGITHAFNRVEHHDALVEAYEPHLQASADAGFQQVICFSGNRGGLDDEQGLENCAIGLKRLLPTAEKLGITLVMELLNSKVDHRDYQCDYSDWGVELCKRIDSPNFKLLYDIYHMQIMEGNVIATIRDKHPYFAHYHTAGVPGRHEIDGSQELHYPAIMRAIAETGFQGFVGQEFIPTHSDRLGSLREAVELCTV